MDAPGLPVARPGRGLLGVVALLVPVLSGCIGAMDTYYAFDPDEHYRNPGVPYLGEYKFGQFSTVLHGGNLSAAEPEVVYLTSTLPAFADPANGATEDSIVYIPMAIWRPANQTEPLPVIVDAGPYYEVFQHCSVEGQVPCRAEMLDDTIDYPGQTTPFLLANMLPHGYVVVQLAVRGTGTAGGCMDLMGDAEVHDLDQAITWLGEQEWSNGNVAMIGASYDGSTPWEVAGTGNPHLKAIVPVSGLPDIYGLMFHNGSAETRGAIMHSMSVYWSYGFDDQFPQNPGLPPEAPWIPPQGGQANGREPYQDVQNLACPDAFEGQAIGQASVATGDRHGDASDYWNERDHRDEVLANYAGSVFLIHGLQDWNVDPHSAIPFNAQLREKGLEMKEWYGQWGHAFPDSTCAQAAPQWVSLPCRLDFAETLLHWFDRHLKGVPDNELGPSVQVEDNMGFWHNMEAFPPTDPAWMELQLGSGGALVPDGAAPEDIRLMPPTNLPAAGIDGGPSEIIELRTEPLAEDLHVAGLAQLKLPFTAEGPGGEIAAWLLDEAPTEKVRAPSAGQVCDDPDPAPPCNGKVRWMPVGFPVIAHTQMNLRYHAGGETPQALVPNTQYVAQMEFEAQATLVPKGHRLVLWLFQYHYPEHYSAQTSSPVTISLGPDTVLRLPTYEADPVDIFPVPGQHFPSRDLVPFMYTLPPVFVPATPVGVPPLMGPIQPGSDVDLQARSGGAGGAGGSGGEADDLGLSPGSSTAAVPSFPSSTTLLPSQPSEPSEPTACAAGPCP